MSERSNRVAVVGAGVAGLVCAYRLTQAGVPVTVYERWPGLGGQAATMDVGDGLRIEHYYHYLFTSDEHMIGLFEELGLGEELVRHPASSAIATGGRVWPFNGALDLLRFKPLPPLSRLRMGLALYRMNLIRDPEPLEHVTARDWIERWMGRPGWKQVWGPLMRGKFGERADDLAMIWIWDKVTRRRNVRSGESRQEAFIYPSESFEPVFGELRRRIEAGGGEILIDRPAKVIDRAGAPGGFEVTAAAADSFRRGLDPQRFESGERGGEFAAVVVATPAPVAARLVGPVLAREVGDEYMGRLSRVEHFTALNLVLELDRPLTEHFWINVADRSCPFVGLVEHTNLVGRERSGGRVFSHVTNYLPAGHELLGLEPDELLRRYEEGLRMLAPDFSRERVRRAWRYAEPAGQPIITTGYRERMPPRQTPIPGLLAVNTAQVYPEDRGTNFAVRDGQAAAREILEFLEGG